MQNGIVLTTQRGRSALGEGAGRWFETAHLQGIFLNFQIYILLLVHISEPPFYPVRSIYLLVFNSPDSLSPQGCQIQAFYSINQFLHITIMFLQILGRPIVGPCVPMVTVGYCLLTDHRARTGHVMYI